MAAAACLVACTSCSPRALAIDGVVVVPGAGFAPGVLYANVENPGGTADTLLSVDVVGATAASLHENVTDSAGRTTMRMVHHLAIPPGWRVSLSPGGVHAMIDGLRTALTRGDSVGVTFHFARAGSVAGMARVVDYTDVGGAAPRVRR